MPSHLHDRAERARRALDRFETPPATELRLEFGGGATAFVVASTCVPDARDPQRAVRTQKSARLSLNDLERDVIGTLGAHAREALVLLMTHEVDEWLRVDGQPVRQPHRDRGDAIRVHLPGGRTQTLGEAKPSERGGDR